MGRVRVLGHIGDALYTVQRLPDEERYSKLNARLEASRTRTLELLPQAESAVDDAEQAKQAIIGTINALRNELIDLDPQAPEYEQERTALLDQITEQLKALSQASMDLTMAQSVLNGYRSDLASLNQRLATLEQGVPPASEEAWCADYTKTIAVNAEVGSVERNDEGTNAPLVMLPGQSPLRDNGPLPNDGVLQPREWMTAEQVFFNAAVLPGVQRWRPQYRFGTITDIDPNADTCGVSLDADSSSANALPINAESTLSDVPIRYMNCDAAAFAVGDRVVVLFQDRDWAQPVVIGFVDNPKPCAAGGGYTFKPVDDTSPSGWPGTYSDRWFAPLDVVDTELEEDTRLESGPHFWRGSGGRVVSFDHGRDNRYAIGAPSTRVTGNPDVFVLGRRISSTGDGVTQDYKVVGAAIFNDMLLIVARFYEFDFFVENDYVWIDRLYFIENPYDTLLESFNQDLPPTTLTPNWQFAAQLSSSVEGEWALRPWFFSPDGSSAATVRPAIAGVHDEGIMRISLTGGVYDEDEEEWLIDVSVSQEDWANPLAVEFLENASPPAFISRAAVFSDDPDWRQKLGGDLSGADKNGVTVGPWDGSCTYVWEDYRYASGEYDPADYEWLEGSCGNPPDSLIVGGTVTAFTSKIVSYRLYAGKTGARVVIRAEIELQHRMAWAGHEFIRNGGGLQWNWTGASLLAVDFDSSENEVPLTFRPSADVQEQGYRVQSRARRLYPRVTNGTGSAPFSPNNFSRLRYYHDNGVFGTNQFGAEPERGNWGYLPTTFNASWINLHPPPEVPYWESGMIVSRAPEFEFGLYRGTAPITGATVKITPEHEDFLFAQVRKYNVWTTSFSPATGCYYPGNYSFTLGAPVDTFYSADIVSFRVIDIDAAQNSVLKFPIELSVQLQAGVDFAGYVADGPVMATQAVGGAEFLLRGENVSLPDAGEFLLPSYLQITTPIPDPPYSEIVDLDGSQPHNMYLATLAIFAAATKPIAPLGLLAREQEAEVGGFEDQWFQPAIVIRDATSAMMSYVESGDTDRRAVFAQFGGSSYNLESEIDLPTKNNLRLLNINPV